jgi:eukaryotic-like serine/threonine-protein kinase
MIIQCDKCKVTFDVPGHLIKPEGSKLRCSQCKHVFKAFPPQTRPADSAGEPPREVAPPPPQAPESPARPAVKAETEPADDEYVSEATLTMVDFSQDVFDISGDIEERYQELGSIGKGGMGEVLLAKDNQLLRKVAIKVLREDVSSAAALSYFLREAQITAQLDHPNIVPLYTVKRPDAGRKNVSFVMKLIKGKSLFDIIAKARQAYVEDPKADLDPDLRLKSRLDYFLKACEGIAYAHRKQVVHRDLKPANIMVGDYGEVYVMDWGIAKMLKGEDEFEPTQATQVTKIFTRDPSESDTEIANQPEGVVGTLSYMSPEQAKARPDVGPASDIFSLGAVLYELATLRPARTGDSKKKLEWAKGGYLNSVDHLAPEKKIDPELKAIIHRATEFNPEDRYRSVNALMADVRAYLQGEEVSELPDNLPRKVWRWMNKHRQLSLILLLSVLLLSAALAIGGLYREQAALKAARLRENRLTRLQAAVSDHAHIIDNNFLRLEGLAKNLANNAIYLIQDAPENDERFYWISEFNTPGQDPPDHDYAPLYEKQVSIDYPVVHTAPGVDRDAVAPLMQRLAPLRHHFKRTLIDSRPGSAAISETEAHRLLTVHGVPIRWAFIGLEAGVMYSYPGKGTYSEDYDPRKRPWYALGKGHQDVRWGNPYFDIQGLGLVLPCATSLIDGENRFYGVLGMDVTFSDIIQDHLNRPGAAGVVESYLLDNKGRIVVRSGQQGVDMKEGDSGPALKLKPFPVPAVATAILQEESGLAEVDREGRSRMVVYYRMPSLGWFYVEELETAAVLRSGG